MKKILVGDDVELVRKYFRTIIEQALGFEFLEALNPLEAFEILENTKPDLIILDMEMPVMDGFSALVKIRNNEATKALPVIVCSALSSSSLFESLVKLNISDYIVKPSSAELIIEKIKKALFI